MRRFSKSHFFQSNIDLVALFLGGTLLFWLMGHLIHPMQAQSPSSSWVASTSLRADLELLSLRLQK